MDEPVVLTSESLRPRSLGEILDRTAQLYRGNFLLYAGIAIVPMAVLALVGVPIAALAGFFGAASRGTFPAAVWPAAVVIAIALVAVPIFLAATVYTQAGLTLAAVKTHMGHKLKIRATLEEVKPHFWRYVWLLILQGVMVALVPAAGAGVLIGGLVYLGTLARLVGNGAAAGAALVFFVFLVFIVAAAVIIWRGMCYSLAIAVCVAENRPAWESLKRAVTLSEGTRGRIFLMFLLVWALSVVISMIAYIPSVIVIAIISTIGHGTQYAPIAVVAVEIVNFLVNFSLQTLITPVYITALVLFYYDQRVRTEGYDIEWMMERAGLTGPGTSTGADPPKASFEPAAGPDSLKEP